MQMSLYQKFFALLLLIALSPGTSALHLSVPEYPSGSGPGQGLQDNLKTEFRAVWVATVNNIDWPSKPGLSVEEQKGEFIRLLDSFSQFNLNVVILQVRAASDAFYPSKSEPWSYFLTGKQGKAPRPFFDPLAWAIEMCHLRGMELHAWFNPFRVRNNGFYALDPSSFAAKHPQFVKQYDNKLFLDPGYPEVRSHVVGVITEVASNYDVDAIILDDYFYPYPVQGKKFGDEKSFARYGGKFYPKRLKDWRRDNINKFISSLHEAIKQVNPAIKFGISPFGIWRNKSVDPAGSAGLRGLSSYDDLYADVRKWLINDWIDYVIPQLYWENGNRFGDFNSMVKWWNDNSFGKPLYIGQALYKSTSVKNGWKKPDELYDQINFLRKNENVRGFAFYSASNISELSRSQVKTLQDNHLNSVAAIDDNRRTPAAEETGKPVKMAEVAKPVRSEVHKDFYRGEFSASLESDPVYARDMSQAVSRVEPVIKKMKGHRLLNWHISNDTISQLVALVVYKKTGNERYKQELAGINGSARFILPDSRWREMKDAKLILVSRNIRNGTEQYSTFFELKRKKIKTGPNPFLQK
jgi:uncharacterized lipoprotein YddW (UPF0748 family)